MKTTLVDTKMIKIFSISFIYLQLYVASVKLIFLERERKRNAIQMSTTNSAISRKISKGILKYCMNGCHFRNIYHCNTIATISQVIYSLKCYDHLATVDNYSYTNCQLQISKKISLWFPLTIVDKVYSTGKMCTALLETTQIQ